MRGKNAFVFSGLMAMALSPTSALADTAVLGDVPVEPAICQVLVHNAEQTYDERIRGSDEGRALACSIEVFHKFESLLTAEDRTEISDSLKNQHEPPSLARPVRARKDELSDRTASAELAFASLVRHRYEQAVQVIELEKKPVCAGLLGGAYGPIGLGIGGTFPRGVIRIGNLWTVLGDRKVEDLEAARSVNEEIGKIVSNQECMSEHYEDDFANGIAHVTPCEKMAWRDKFVRKEVPPSCFAEPASASKNPSVSGLATAGEKAPATPVAPGTAGAGKAGLP